MTRRRPVRRAVLLDAMGTLLELEPPGPALVRELRAQLGVEVSPALAERAIQAEMSYYRTHHCEGRDAHTLDDLRRRCAGVLGEALGAAATSVAPEALVGPLLGALRFSAYADAAPALRALRAQGRRLVVVSNWDVSLPAVLGQLGLAQLLDDVVTSAEAGVSKPQPQIFAVAMRRAGLAPSQAVHVGDSVEHDVRGARAAGLEAVLIDRGSAPVARDDVTVIRSLAELARLAA